MKRIGLVATIGMLLSGCVFGMMEKGLGALVGKDVKTAFNVLGYPSGKQEFGSETVYFWSVSRSGTYSMPQTSTTSGMVGTTPVYGTTTYYQQVPYNYTCLVKIITAKSGQIISWEYEGNLAGCSAYAGRLNDFYNENSQVVRDQPEPEFNNLIVPAGVSYAEYKATKDRCAAMAEPLPCFYQAGYKPGKPLMLPTRHLDTWRKNNFPNEPSAWTAE